MRCFALSAVGALLAGSPALAQADAMPDMQGMTTKAKPVPPVKSKQRNPAMAKPRPVGADTATAGHAAHAMPGTPLPYSAASGAGQSMPGMGAMPPAGSPFREQDIVMAGAALPAGNAAPPPVPTDHYADRTYPAAANARGRALMMHQQGGQQFYQVMFNLAEYQIHDGHDGYRWDGEAWFGGDINRVTLRTEGEGTLHEGIDDAEAQLLYSRAIGPYFNLQGGVRHDFSPTPTRTYVTVGVEGLAPYMVQTEARAFVATTGQVLGRLEGWYDQRLTQRLVLQPRVELNLAAQTDRRTGVGAGLSDAELGLRLRYEVAREFAPYIGISYQAKNGRTADYARAAGADASTTSLVAGTRFWF